MPPHRASSRLSTQVAQLLDLHTWPPLQPLLPWQSPATQVPVTQIWPAPHNESSVVSTQVRHDPFLQTFPPVQPPPQPPPMSVGAGACVHWRSTHMPPPQSPSSSQGRQVDCLQTKPPAQ